MIFDVFNGDADGILSLVQLRLSDPRPEAKLVTGRKRDIKLLGQVKASVGDHVTVLDISARSNMDDLIRILDDGASVFYADHHNADDLPDYPNLFACIDTSPEICTAMIIDRCLGGAHRAWAVTAAFGDNFPKLALAQSKGYNFPLAALERLGVLVNYNGYGASVKDLHMHPADLYRSLVQYETPMAFLADDNAIFRTLDDGYKSDMSVAKNADILDESPTGLVLTLPDAAASRRVSGVYGNALAQENPNRAHAVLTRSGQGYVVSVRAPLARRSGADALCLQFDTGGGRAAAAGINHLPDGDVVRFTHAFRDAFKP